MKNYLWIIIFVVAQVVDVVGQTSDWRMRQIQSELDRANSQLEEINRRERAKELAAKRAEEERLVNMPLDDDLQQIYARSVRSIFSTIKYAPRASQACRDIKIKLSKVQDQRNAQRASQR